jgi:putative ABC transport system permease protein
MMVLREIERRPLRTILSAAGIASAVGLIIFGHCGIDALNHYLESTFRREQRQDLAVSLSHPVGQRAVGELARLPGVFVAEGLRTIPIRVRHGHRSRDSVLMGISDGTTLRRLVERGGREVRVPEDGILVTSALGDILDLRVGDRPELELLDGRRLTVRATVAGFVDESVGLQIYGRSTVASALERDLGAVSSVLLQIDPAQRAAVEERLRRSPNVVDVSDVVADIERLRDMNGQAMDIWTFVSVTLSAFIVFGVVYTNARIALATRGRELASLRVLGMSRGEVSSILIGGLAIEVALAIPAGLLFGWGLAAFFFTRGTDQETFRFQVAIEGRTYALAVIVALVSALTSALWVRRNVDKLDLIGVLKTRE